MQLLYQSHRVPKEKRLNFHFLNDLFDPDDKNRTFLISSIFEYEYMKYLSYYHNTNNKDKLRGFHYILTETSNNTKDLYRFLENTTNDDVDFYVGPKNCEKLKVFYFSNLMREKALFSHGATEPALDKLGELFSIARVLPSDTYRVNVLVNLIEHFNWQYFFVLKSNNQEKQFQYFYRILGNNRTCKEFHIRDSSTTNLCQFIKRISYQLNTRAIVLFTTLKDSRTTVFCLKKYNLQNRFNLIFLYGHNRDPYIFPKDSMRMLDGSLGIEAELPGGDHYLADFWSNFISISLLNAKDWIFYEYWGERFKCHVPRIPKKYPNNCSYVGDNFEPQEGWNATHYDTEKVKFLPAVFDCITHVVSRFLDKHCDGTAPRYCTKSFIRKKTGVTISEGLSRFMKDVFTSRDLQCPLDYIWYNVYNYNDMNRTFDAVFSWKLNHTKFSEVLKRYQYSSRLPGRILEFIQTKDVWWGNVTKFSAPSGNCSSPCSLGFYPVTIPYTKNLCWICEQRCEEKNQIYYNGSCEACKRFERTDQKLQQCLTLNELTLQEIHSLLLEVELYSIAILLFFTLFASGVVVYFRKTQVFSSSGANLWTFILSSILVTLISAFFYTRKPSTTSCIFIDVFAPLSTLSTKLLVLRKVFLIKKAFHGRRKRRVDIPESKLFILLPFLLECMLIVSFAYNGYQFTKPMHEMSYDQEAGHATEHCVNIKYGFVLFLPPFLICCLTIHRLYSLRHLPHNFHEAVYLFNATCGSLVLFVTTMMPFVVLVNDPFLNEVFLSWYLIGESFWQLLVFFGKKMAIVLMGKHKIQKEQNIPIRMRPFISAR